MSSVTNTNYFTIFLKYVDVDSLLLVFIYSTINIIFLLTNNHSPHQQFVNFFEK